MMALFWWWFLWLNLGMTAASEAPAPVTTVARGSSENPTTSIQIDGASNLFRADDVVGNDAGGALDIRQAQAVAVACQGFPGSGSVIACPFWGTSQPWVGLGQPVESSEAAIAALSVTAEPTTETLTCSILQPHAAALPCWLQTQPNLQATGNEFSDRPVPIAAGSPLEGWAALIPPSQWNFWLLFVVQREEPISNPPSAPASESSVPSNLVAGTLPDSSQGTATAIALSTIFLEPSLAATGSLQAWLGGNFGTETSALPPSVSTPFTTRERLLADTWSRSCSSSGTAVFQAACSLQLQLAATNVQDPWATEVDRPNLQPWAIAPGAIAQLPVQSLELLLNSSPERPAIQPWAIAPGAIAQIPVRSVELTVGSSSPSSFADLEASQDFNIETGETETEFAVALPSPSTGRLSTFSTLGLTKPESSKQVCDRAIGPADLAFCLRRSFPPTQQDSEDSLAADPVAIADTSPTLEPATNSTPTDSQPVEDRQADLETETEVNSGEPEIVPVDVETTIAELPEATTSLPESGEVAGRDRPEAEPSPLPEAETASTPIAEAGANSETLGILSPEDHRFSRQAGLDLAQNQIGRLIVRVRDLRNRDGQLCASLFDRRQGFPGNAKEALQSNCFPFPEDKDDPVELTYDLPSWGNYAIALFHDENANFQLDLNEAAQPLEGFGFSNNPAIERRLPKFGDALIYVAGNKTETAIAIQYPPEREDSDS